MTVTKVLGFDLRIPKHLRLHFSGFSTILYGIYKFDVFETKEKENELLHLGPWKFLSSQGRSLADGTEQNRGGTWFFGVQARRRRGLGWGKVEGSGLPSLENLDLKPECLDYHKSGVSEHMAGLSGPLPVRSVPPTGQTGPTQTKT